MKFRLYFITLFALVSVTLQAADILSEADALRVLERVARAPAVTAFQGVYVQQHGEYMETIRVCHVIEGGVVHERREALDGPPREMVRLGDQISLYLPDGVRTKSFDPRSNGRMFPRLLPDNPAEVLVNYAIRRQARERVAGLEADVYDLEPRDRFRYPHRIWVHVDSGLLLKAATLGFKREIFDLYAFSQLMLGAQVDRNQLKPVNPVRPMIVEMASTPGPQAAQWEAKGLPAGFRLIQQSQRVLSGRGQSVIQHLYTDGVATLSVFLEAMQPSAPLGAARQGALSIYGRQEASQHIAVLGEVPPETVELFAKAYKYTEKAVKK